MSLNHTLASLSTAALILCSANLVQAQAPTSEDRGLDRAATNEIATRVDRADRDFDWGWLGLLGLIGLAGLTGRSRHDYPAGTTPTSGTTKRV